MNKETRVFIDNIHKATIWKADRGYVYIYKNIFLWKEEEDLLPKDRDYIPVIKKFKVRDLKMFTKLTQLEDEYEWADWWVWRYYFKDEPIRPILEVEDYGFTDEFAEEIGYNPWIYKEKGVIIDKTVENTIVFKYEEKDADSAYILFDRLIIGHVFGEFITIHANRDLEDSLDLYRFVKSSTEIKITLDPEDFLQIRDIVIRFLDEIK